jgi:hypothetical protein
VKKKRYEKEQTMSIGSKAKRSKNRDLFVKFIDLFLFYNLVKNKNIILGPFSSLSAVSNKKMDYFQINSGLLFYIHDADNSILLNSDLLNIEIGYTYNNIGLVQ